jgi:hydroxyacylglutathione hydrolase
LPGETRVYCGHEYTAANARFAVTIDPDNAALRRREREVTTLRAEGKFTIPSTMAEECAANPFLRADDANLAAAVDRRGAPPFEVFGEIRRLKDNFR